MTVADALAELGLKLNFTLIILTGGLLLARILPVIILSPFLGGEVVPTEVKIGLGMLLAVVLYPAVSERMALLPTSAFPFIAVLLKELFIGVCLSFIVNMVFEAARVAGTLVDTLAGTSMAQLMVPQLQTQASIWASIKFQFTVVLFLTLDGHHLVINALGDSFASIPLDRFPAFSGGVWPFFDTMIRVSADLFAIGLTLAAPALLVTLITDVAFGMVNKVAPQIQVYFVAMSVKPMVATLIIIVALNLIVGRLTSEFETMILYMRRAIAALA